MLKGKEPDWEAIKLPKGNIALRAFEEIQAIKAKRMEKMNKARVDEVKKQQRQDRLNSEALHEVGRRAAILEMESQTRQQKMKAILGGRKYEDDQNPFSTPVEIKPKSILLQDKEINALVPYKQNNLAQASQKHDRNNILVHL